MYNIIKFKPNIFKNNGFIVLKDNNLARRNIFEVEAKKQFDFVISITDRITVIMYFQDHLTRDKQKIYWKVTADSKNSQRNKPETGLKNPGNNKFVKIEKSEALIETEVKSESSEVILSRGLAGGDKFTIEAGTKKDEWEKKVEIENWRKLWYQRSFHKNATAPSMSTPEKQLKDVFIEFISD